MTSNYEQLRTRINELLPDRMELKQCETWIAYRGEACLFLQDCIGGYRLLETHIDEGDMVYTILPLAKPSSCEILGKPLTIEDVLRALEKHADQGDLYHLAASGEFFNGQHEDVCLFDLTKPLSAPENEAACAAVLKLLSV